MKHTITALAMIAALAAALTLTTPDTAQAQTATDIDCQYNQAILGCRRQIVYVDAFPGTVDTYTGSIKTPDGYRTAQCAHINNYQTACILGALLPVIPNPQLPTPTPAPVVLPAAPQLAFTGSTSDSLAMAGIGLIGAGALMLGARRREQ